MNTNTAPAALPSCKEYLGLLAFTVDLGDRQVPAYLSDGVWQARYSNSFSDASLTERYQSNRSMIDAAVARRVQAGGRVPVVLRPSDL